MKAIYQIFISSLALAIVLLPVNLYAQPISSESINEETDDLMLTSDIKIGNVIVEFVDENNNQLLDPVTLSGQIGENYSINLPKIDNYTINRISTGSITGTYKENKQLITVVYSELIPTNEIDVAYVDENGKSLAPNDIITGEIGTTYNIVAKDFANYKLVDTFGMTTGEFDTKERGVTFIYEMVNPVQSPEVINEDVDTNEGVDTNKDVDTNEDVIVEPENESVVETSDVKTNVTANESSLATTPKFTNTSVKTTNENSTIDNQQAEKNTEEKTLKNTAIANKKLVNQLIFIVVLIIAIYGFSIYLKHHK